MTTNTQVPSRLKSIQQWFGSIITRPIDDENRMSPVSPAGTLMTEEAKIYIAPSNTLESHQRIEIYNQQYWWRLLKVLQDGFPLVTRLFGCYDFNQTFGFPYLTKYFPKHWSLSYLGENLKEWIAEHYHAKDKELVLNSAMLDYAFGHSFIIDGSPPIRSENLPIPGDISSLLSVPLRLQPYVYLFAFPYDLFVFRTKMLKHDPDYWIKHAFPSLPRKKPLFFVLYRNGKNQLMVDTIKSNEFHLLKKFEQSSTIEAICDWLEAQETSLQDDAAQNLSQWTQRWIALNWLRT